EVAAQSAARLSLIPCQLGDGKFFCRTLGLSQPVLRRGQDEGVFGTGEQDLIDAGEFVAEFEIIDVALDGGQSGSERGLEGDEKGDRKSTRLNSSHGSIS